MTAPDPEESAAIVAALEVAVTTPEHDGARGAEPPQSTRWRRAGRLYGTVDDERLGSTFDAARRT